MFPGHLLPFERGLSRASFSRLPLLCSPLVSQKAVVGPAFNHSFSLSTHWLSALLLQEQPFCEDFLRQFLGGGVEWVVRGTESEARLRGLNPDQLNVPENSSPPVSRED